jgi:hypothetical protein
MADIAFTTQEEDRINAVLGELDPGEHELLRPFYDQLAAEDWQFICDYVRAKMRAVLETGLLLRSVTERARTSRLVDEGAIRTNFVRTLWNYNFSFRKPVEDTFVELAGGSRESAVSVAAEAIIEAAEDLMFGTFEDAHEQLLDSAGATPPATE